MKRPDLPPVSENAWMTDVVEAATLFGWRIYHTYDSRRSAPGFPDLILARPPVLIAAELKSDRGRLSIEQQGWLRTLEQCTEIRTRLWRPGDRDRVLSELSPDRLRLRLDGHET